MKWTDLQYILAVYEGGSISEAARILNVNPTTVSRRIKSIEEQSGVGFLDRQRDHIGLTPSGQELIHTAKEMEALVNDLSARIVGLDHKLSGSIRVTSVNALYALWMPDIRKFNSDYPDITLELLSSYSIANLTNREADVAIRISPSAPEHMIGGRHAQVFYAIYGSPELAKEINSDNYAHYPWVSWDLATTRATDTYIEKHVKNAKISLRVDRVNAMTNALESGLGISILPCFVGDQNSDIVRIGDYFEGGNFIWLLTHPDLRTTTRITTLMKYFRELIARDKNIIEGSI